MLWTPPPGTIGLTRCYGHPLSRPALIGGLGGVLTGDLARFTHAFITLDNDTIMEPWPDGAARTAHRDYADQPVTYGWMIPLTGRQRRAIVDAACALDGTGYRLRDYLQLGLWRRGLRTDALLSRLADTRHLLPFQFVAEVYRRAGIDLGLPGDCWFSADITARDLVEAFVTATDWDIYVPNAHLT